MVDSRTGKIDPSFVPSQETPQPLPGGERFREGGGRLRKTLTAVGDEGSGRPPSEGQPDSEGKIPPSGFTIFVDSYSNIDREIETFDRRIQEFDRQLKASANPVVYARFIVIEDIMLVIPGEVSHIAGLEWAQKKRLVNPRGEINCAGYVDVHLEAHGFGFLRTTERVMHGSSQGFSDNGSLTVERSDQFKQTVLREKLGQYFTVE